jgi:hypothetical protein
MAGMEERAYDGEKVESSWEGPHPRPLPQGEKGVGEERAYVHEKMDFAAMARVRGQREDDGVCQGDAGVDDQRQTTDTGRSRRWRIKRNWRC